MELSFVLSKCPFSTKLENKHSYALFSLFSVFLNTHTHTHTHTHRVKITTPSYPEIQPGDLNPPIDQYQAFVH